MTFLEYVIEKLYRTPAFTSGGQSWWHCANPAHPDRHPSFCTLPHDVRYKDRFKCWTCDIRGDTFDFVRIVKPELTYPERKALLLKMRNDFDGGTDPYSFSILGEGIPRNTEPEALQAAVVEIVGSLGYEPGSKWFTETQRQMWAVVYASDIADSYGVSLEAVAVKLARSLLDAKKQRKIAATKKRRSDHA